MRHVAHVSPASVTGCTVSATNGSTSLSGSAPDVCRTPSSRAPGALSDAASTSGLWYLRLHRLYEYAWVSPAPHPFSLSQYVHTLHPGFSWHARQHAPSEEVRNAPPSNTFPSSSVFRSALHGVTGWTPPPTERSSPAPQYGIAGGATGIALASAPSRVRQLAMTLSGPPTRKHPGQSGSGPFAKLMRRPSRVMTTSASSHVSAGASWASPPPDRNEGAGSATLSPSHVAAKSLGSTSAAYITGTVTP